MEIIINFYLFRQAKQDLYFKFARQLLSRDIKDYGKFPELK